jgi:aquaporin Z
LGKIRIWDAVFYTVAQFVGGTMGILVIGAIVGSAIASPSVAYAATLPGPQGALVAFAAEFTISFLLMLVILGVSNRKSIANYTGLFAGILIALYIALESPLSGMSMNPARTFASAFAARLWTGIWVYFTAPLFGMLAAAKAYAGKERLHAVRCAKLHHDNDKRCIFCGKTE